MFKKIKNAVLFVLGLRSEKKRVYCFNKQLWYIDELTYAEDGRIREILKDVFGSSFTPEAFGEAIDVMYEKGAIPALLAVVLKPYEPTPIHRWWNKRHAAQDPVGQMKNSEIARVVSDFFLLNTRWIADLSSLLTGSALKTVTKLTSSIPQNQRN